MPFESCLQGSYRGPPGTYSRAMNTYSLCASSTTSNKRTTFAWCVFVRMAISLRTATLPPSPPCPAYFLRNRRRWMHFNAHNSCVSVSKQSLTVPNAPRPKVRMSKY